MDFFNTIGRLFRKRQRRGRVLEVKFGYNPNSSSIGADLTPLVMFSSFLSIAVPALMIFLKARTRKGKGEPLATDASAAPAS